MENRLVAEGIVRCYDSVSELDKHALIATSDLEVIPFLFETIPLVLLEAWAMGKPVIGASIPSLHSLITSDGDGSVLVPLEMSSSPHKPCSDSSTVQIMLAG